MRHPGTHRANLAVEQGTRTFVHSLQVADEIALVHAGDGEITLVHHSILFVSSNEHLLADRSVVPVCELGHLLDKLLIHNHFAGIPRRPAFKKADAHQVIEFRRTVVLVGNIEQFTVIFRQGNIVSVGSHIRQVVGGGNATHLRKALERFHGPDLCLTVSVEQVEVVQVLVVITGIGIGHLLVLPAYDEHHHHQEYVDKHLHAQQTELPATGILRIVLQGSVNRNPLIQLCRYNDGNDEHE